MDQKLKTSLSSLLFPSFLAVASLAVMAYGLFSESSLIGIGFVLLVTSVVIGVSWWGAATSTMDQSNPHGAAAVHRNHAA